jgi:hypothetical protein
VLCSSERVWMTVWFVYCRLVISVRFVSLLSKLITLWYLLRLLWYILQSLVHNLNRTLLCQMRQSSAEVGSYENSCGLQCSWTPSRKSWVNVCALYLQCKRAENFRKHMQLLWQNSIPMCIEVLLCADCQCGQQKSQSPEVANIPSSTDLLLEQWMVTMVNKRWVSLW